MSHNINSTPTISNSPINRLNIDVLSKIFWTNTDVFTLFRDPEPSSLDSDGKINPQTRPLIVLRRTSQVCHKWRATILESPALWGRVIELNLLQGNHRALWRQEILERAGQSPLHIVGIDVEPDFIVELLDNHWCMVQRISVSIKNINLETYGPQLWDHLQRPAPLLNIFHLSFGCQHPSIKLNPNLSLFADSAPVLRNFSMALSPGMQFSYRAPWLKNLRNLSISCESPRFNTTELIDALSNIPLLERLSLTNTLSPPNTNTLSPAPPNTLKDGQFRSGSFAILASLTMLTIVETFESSLFLLKQIIAPSKCALFLHLNCTSQMSDTDIYDICKESARYFNGCLASLTKQMLLNSLGLDTSRHSNMLAAPSTSLPVIAPNTQFSVEFNNVSTIRGLSSLTIAILLDFLDFGQFTTHIKEFKFLMRELDPSRLARVYNPRLNTIGSFFASLSSVTYLQITLLGFDLLVGAQNKQHDVFPSLETLEIRERPPGRKIGVWFHGLIADFLNTRLDKGRRLAILDISDCLQVTEKSGEWRYLEVFKGLKVVWGRGPIGSKEEYICGSGKPQNIGSWTLDVDSVNQWLADQEAALMSALFKDRGAGL